MKKFSTLLLLITLVALKINAQTYHQLSVAPLIETWSDISRIMVDDNWTNIPSIRGFSGDDGSTTAAGTDPQTILAPNATLDVFANRSQPSTFISGGVGEFEIVNPTIGLQGSGTADYPQIVIYLNTTGTAGNTISYNVRDIDSSADNAIQQVALQYRIGNTGNFINIPAGFVTDATTAATGTQVTAVNLTLPAATENQPMVEIRIITTNAAGSDEWVGIDDITVTAGAPTPITLQSFSVGRSGNGTEVNWFVNCTSASVKFNVERSPNGTQFTSIYSETATQARCAASFRFVDANALSGGNYYRLKMTDLDGSVSYSRIAFINNRTGSETVLSSLQPNVITSDMNLFVQSSASQKLDLMVSDFSGRVIKRETRIVNAGENILQINLGSIPAGNYQVSGFVAGNKLNTLRFIKQ